jgi:hypothetical protein
MTMSRSLGFLKAGGDVDGVLKQLQKELDYEGIVSPSKATTADKAMSYGLADRT